MSIPPGIWKSYVLFVTNTKVTFRLTSEYFHLKGHSSKNILQLPRVGVEGRSESGKLVNSRRTVKITQTETIDSLVNDETKQDLMQVTYKAKQIVTLHTSTVCTSFGGFGSNAYLLFAARLLLLGLHNCYIHFLILPSYCYFIWNLRPVVLKKFIF